MFLYTISCMQGGHTTLTLIFIIFYMTAALLQVWPGRGVGGGQGWPAGWEGRTGQVRPVSAGQGRSPSPVPERLCGSRGLALLL